MHDCRDVRALLKKLKGEQAALDKKEASMYSRVFKRLAQQSAPKQTNTVQVTSLLHASVDTCPHTLACMWQCSCTLAHADCNTPQPIFNWPLELLIYRMWWCARIDDSCRHSCPPLLPIHILGCSTSQSVAGRQLECRFSRMPAVLMRMPPCIPFEFWPQKVLQQLPFWHSFWLWSVHHVFRAVA